MSEGKLVRIRAVVTGRVQGVGFRYFARHAALALKVSGWVMNRPDGGVEFEVQGPELTIGAFRDAMRQGPQAGYVDSYQEEPLPALAGDKGFVIRH